MTTNKDLSPAIYRGRHDHHRSLVRAIAPLTADQLALRASANLDSIGQIAAHIIAVRARWFQFGETGDAVRVFKPFSGWDSRTAPVRSTEELVAGLEATWTGMQEAIDRWTVQEWAQTWPGEDDTEPEVVTRQWVIWYLLEHDIYHGGQISLTLLAHGLPCMDFSLAPTDPK
jgi:uncharacterized damage-inducible protein DinB